MLKEFPNLRQGDKGYRRLFYDEDFDLYIWYEAEGRSAVGFQLVYFVGEEQKAFTWESEGNSDHMTVDGWDSNRSNLTPFLVADGQADFSYLYGEMKKRMDETDRAIKEMVLGALSIGF
jgi:hypothetical protein